MEECGRGGGGCGGPDEAAEKLCSICLLIQTPNISVTDVSLTKLGRVMYPTSAAEHLASDTSAEKLQSKIK